MTLATGSAPASSASSETTPPYTRVEGIHVLRVRGTDYEMGHQHGQLLREAIPRGPLPYFAHYVEKLLSAGLLGPFGGVSSRAIGGALSATVGRRIAKRFPPRIREAMAGLADGAGLSRKEIMRAVTMPETYLWVGSV